MQERNTYTKINGIKVADAFEPETFGRLTTVGPMFYLKGTRMQVCQCSCGTFRVVVRSNIMRGFTQSCGCQNAENIKTKTIRHGHSANGVWSPEYASYVAMKSRCTYKLNNRYKQYAARGIKICDRWLEPNSKGFLNFLEDMGPKPSTKHSIDRIDVNGDYCPENCRWATDIEQANNTRRTIYITALGKTQKLQEWVAETGIPSGTIRRRLKVGWSPDMAVSKPPRINSKNKEKYASKEKNS